MSADKQTTNAKEVKDDRKVDSTRLKQGAGLTRSGEGRPRLEMLNCGCFHTSYGISCWPEVIKTIPIKVNICDYFIKNRL